MKMKQIHLGGKVEAQSVYRATKDDWLPSLIVGPAANYAKRKLFRVLLFHPGGLIGKALRTAAEMRPWQPEWNGPPKAMLLELSQMNRVA